MAVGTDAETFAGIVAAPIGAAGAAPARAREPQTASLADAQTAGGWDEVVVPTLGAQADLGPRYRVEKLLGEGGMGAVYKAYDNELGRTVALKLIRPALALDPNITQRFKQELLLASKISHKNILRIHDLGEAAGTKFISMAFVEGCDLHQLLCENGKLPVERAVNIGKQLCAALDAAHAEGVVHRDFKPQNILLATNDQVYVSDFGLAKSLEADIGLSRTGEFLGTPRYMAPEQVAGGVIDHRVDLYALGLILYEMLTGDVPFHADTTMQLMYKRVNEAPKSPKELNPGLPEWLVKVVMRCLERDPERRYQNARDILTDLQNELAPVGSKSGSVAFTIRRVELDMPAAKMGLLIAIALVVIAAGLLAVPSVRHRLFGDETTAQGAPMKHVAVLPIKVLGDESAVGYIGQGVTDDLTARLYQLKNLQIASPTAIAKLKSGLSPDQAAKTLGANVVIQGTLQSQQDRISLLLTLNDSTGKQLWTGRFAGVRQDILTLEDDVYNKVVAALAVKTSAEEMARSSVHATENYAAYDLYLKGKNAFQRGELDPKNVAQAIGFYEDALKQDPHFALAWAGIADASLRMYRDNKDEKWSQKALNAAEQAATWGGDIPDVHFSVGGVYSATGKTAEAIAELQSALKLAPNSDDGYRRLGDAYRAAGQKQEAIAAYQQATKINPYYWINFNALAGAEFRYGDNDAAMTAYKKVTELAPGELAGWLGIANTLYQENKWDEAIAAYKKSIDVKPHYLGYSNLGAVYYYKHQYNEAAQAFEKAVQLNPNQEIAIGNLADSYYWSGDKQKANASYDQAIGLALKALQVDPRSAEEMGRVAMYYASKGDLPTAKRYIQRARAIAPDIANLAYTEAVVHTRAGELTPAYASLREAFSKGYSVDQAKNDPELNVLAGQPEFQNLVAQYSNKN
ncbi:MAG: protein kinase domain-containing protein [Terriglobales bacterium]